MHCSPLGQRESTVTPSKPIRNAPSRVCADSPALRLKSCPSSMRTAVFVPAMLHAVHATDATIAAAARRTRTDPYVTGRPVSRHLFRTAGDVAGGGTGV